jgi:hypothetical protein
MQVVSFFSKPILFVLFQAQKVLLVLSYALFYHFNLKPKAQISWVIGVEEIAALNKYISISIPDSYSVCLAKNKYYNFDYNFSFATSGISWIEYVKRLFVGPALLGYLLNRADRFFYIWSTGFLISIFDQREFEFKFIKTRPSSKSKGKMTVGNRKYDYKKSIVCFFVGNDIRAPRLSIEFARNNAIELSACYYSVVAPARLTEEYDKNKRQLAKVADDYADIIFNAKVDQISYLKKATLPFIYFYPDNSFSRNKAKFSILSDTKIVHAPSSPVIKGTQLVRAAIAKLKKKGYRINYVELVGVKNEVVLEELRTAHIVLNEFYDLVPGVFGVEALASFCALMTAADETIETDLPQGSNQAWLSTKSYEVYDNLKYLLDNPDKQLLYAERGYEWALQHASQSASGKKLRKILDLI